MELDMKEYKVKPCPFCGKTEFLSVMPRDFFEELYDKNGGACLTITCSKCHVDMYEHDFNYNDYHAKARILVDKWNRRAEQ